MGLDMYLNAKIYVPNKFYPPVPLQEAASSVHMEDQPNAAAAEIGAPLQMRVIPLNIGKEPQDNPTYNGILELLEIPPSATDAATGFYVDLRVGYWRKANQILRWMEENVAEGELKNVTDYPVDRTDLERLRTACQDVLATVVKGKVTINGREPATWESYEIESIDYNLIAETLAPSSGFFYGSTEIDQGYVQDLEETVAMVTKVLEEPALADAEFIFHAWW